ncbi:MAG: HEAT repeat domain-containing protein [Planctomycetota bacterium]
MATNRRTWSCAAAAVAALSCCSGVSAHGGQFRGPSSIVPVTSSSAGSPAAPATPSAPPGPSTGASGGAGSTGSLSPGAAPSATAPMGRQGPKGVLIGDDLTRWQYWWEWNKDAFLRLKTAVHTSHVARASAEEWMAHRRRNDALDTLRPTSAQLVEDVLPSLRAALERDDQRDVTSSCLVALAKIGRDHPDFRILPLIRARLRSRDQEIRETAALALGIARRPESVETLLALARDDDQGRQLCDRSSVDERTRAFAAYGLGLTASSAWARDRQRAMHALTSLLFESDGGRNLHVATIHAVRLVASAAQGSAAETMRRDAVRALWAFYDDDDRPGLQDVRAHVLPSIAKIMRHGSAAAAAEHKGRLADELRNNDEIAITQAAATALGLLCASGERRAEDRKYSEILRRQAERSLDQQTRSFCLMALGQIGGKANRNELLKMLQSGNKAIVKPWAAMALGVLAWRGRQASGHVDAEIGAVLQAQLRQVKNDQTISSVAVALGLCHYRPASDELRTLLAGNAHRDEYAGYLCLGLALMGDRRSRDDIHRVVLQSAQRPLLLRQAAVALGLLGDKRAADLLVGMLRDGASSLGSLASISIALGQIGDRRSIDPLVELLHNEDRPGLSRAFAAVALGGVADKDVLPWSTELAAGINYRAAVETLTNGVSGVLDIL